MNLLSEFSNEELARELERRRLEAEAEKTRARIVRNRKILEHRDALLALMEHSRSSCASSNNAYHNEQGYVRCSKCALEQLDEYNLANYEITLDVRLHCTNP